MVSIAKWKQQILESVWRPQDRTLLTEALSCLQVGALRSAYIMTWITIAESLKATLKAMSLRDHEIVKIVSQIENFEGQQKSVDGFILNKSIELGIIPSDYQERMHHLFKMRSIYTHPYETGPTNDEVRAAIRVAVDAALSRHPFFRHGYINDRMNVLFDNPHFLDDDAQKIEAYGRGLAERIDPSLLGYFLNKLLSRLEPVVDDPDLELILRRGVGVATAFIDQANADLSAEQWQAVSLLEQFPKAASLVLRDSKVWKRLGEQAQDMTLSLQLFPETGRPSTGETNVMSLHFFVLALERGELSKQQNDKVNKAVTLANLQTLANSPIPLEYWANRIVEDLESHDWYIQNPAINALSKVGADRVSRECDESTQELLGRNVLQAAEGSARAASNFLSGLSTTTDLWPKAFLRGVFFEPFVNEAGTIRFKTNALKPALLGVLRNAGDHKQQLTSSLIEILHKSNPSQAHPVYNIVVDSVLKACHSVLSMLAEEEESARESVKSLCEVLASLPQETRESPPF